MANSSDKEERSVASYNAEMGTLKYYDCPKCNNRGYIAIIENGTMVMQPCDCKEIRKSLRLIAESGINEDYKLETFNATEKWQQNILECAYRFLVEPKGWFFIGGQVGSGKTHICTGIVRKLIDAGNPARYMLWRDESTRLKASVNNPAEYAELIEPLKTIKVLYIDDFFKTNNQATPTPADVNLAFEILNARYNRKDLITLISSEFHVDEIARVDEAVGSRICERSFDWQQNITRDKKRNYRMRGYY